MADKWPRISFYILIAGLLFSSGLAMGVFKFWPYSIVENIGMQSLSFFRSPSHYLRTTPEKFLHRQREGTVDMTDLDVEKVSPGVTFLTGFFEQSNGMRLIDLDGKVLHEWKVSFNETWPDATHVPRQYHDWDLQIHGAALYPNGDIVFNFQYAGLAKIDSCSRVIWKMPAQTHHSVFIAENGNLWVPSRKLRREAAPEYPFVPTPYQDEYILELSPDGEVIDEISLIGAIVESGYSALLFANGTHEPRIGLPLDGDFTHLNDVELLSEEDAKAFPMFETGDILLSLRNLNLIMVIDAQDHTMKWSMTGPFNRQHDPDFVNTGHISVFDNRRGNADGGSRIIEIDPQSRNVFEVFTGTSKYPFYTAVMGDHQQLPNGNMLITESEEGHVIEVSDQGEIVWSYANHWDDEFVALVPRGTRYPASYAEFIAAQPACDQ